MRPNNSFKPTSHRGVGHVLCATLARVRRSATGRLNSGVSAHMDTMQKIVFILIATTLSACASNPNAFIDQDVIQFQTGSSKENAENLGLDLGSAYPSAAELMTRQGWVLRQGCEALPTGKGHCTADFRKQNHVVLLIVTSAKSEPIVADILLGECVSCER
jgi:hypothetical protein